MERGPLAPTGRRTLDRGGKDGGDKERDAIADGRDAIMADGSVKLALPNRTPTSPKGFMILGLSIMLGLLAGIGLAVWRDRRL